MLATLVLFKVSGDTGRQTRFYLAALIIRFGQCRKGRPSDQTHRWRGDSPLAWVSAPAWGLTVGVGVGAGVGITVGVGVGAEQPAY